MRILTSVRTVDRYSRDPECPSEYNGGNLGFMQTDSLLLLFL